jgi:hypothetical protein
MKMLQDLGFIDIRPGLASDFQYILLYNPILIISETYQRLNIPQDVAYEALKVRLIEIGAAEELSVIAT